MLHEGNNFVCLGEGTDLLHSVWGWGWGGRMEGRAIFWGGGGRDSTDFSHSIPTIFVKTLLYFGEL